MDSNASTVKHKPHAVCIPCPAQGHINSMLQFAKLLHFKGFHITFIYTDSTYNKIIVNSGPSSLDGLPDFRFETIPDGRSAAEIIASDNFCSHYYGPFRQLLNRLNESGGPKVTCIVSDTFLSFTLQIAAEFGIPDLSFCSMSACGFWGYFYVKELMDRGIVPFKNEDQLKSGYLDTPIHWVPGMDNMRLRDFSSFIRTTNPKEPLLNFIRDQAQDSLKASAIVIHTFEDLEAPVLEGMSTTGPPVYAIGPLNLMCQQTIHESENCTGSNLWKNESGCMEWLDRRAPGSVIYVSFGSLTVVTKEQLTEFAWGLANSGRDFLWVIRPDIVSGDSGILPEDFLSEVNGRGLLISWCSQEEVLMHPSVGLFLTHCGWNSTMESITSGVPMLCWPYFAEQHTNCRFVCNEWGIGMEIDNAVTREEVERLIKDMIGGEKGKEMKSMALKWKESAMRAIEPTGKSFQNLETVIEDVLLHRK